MDDHDIPEASAGELVKEQCRYISATNRWYTLIYQRPLYEKMPDRSKMFPSLLKEIDKPVGYLLIAEYPDGHKETFTCFEEISVRFTAILLELREDNSV
jgi:hypothetical protein